MTTASDNAMDLQARPLVVSRTFPVARAWVFKAWTSAEHIRRWFCPAGFTVPEAEVDFRVGGVFNVCMRSPDGQDYWTRGHYTEIVPDSRLVIEMSAVDEQGKPLFHARTVAIFADAESGTRLEVTQRYTVLAPAAEAMLQGAPKGWEQALDRLAREAARMPGAVPEGHSVVHASFTVERTYPASRARVFKALTDPAAKAKWFAGGNGYTVLAREMDVRPGGRELVKGQWESGVVSTFEAVYHDVVPDERIVYAYTMHLDARKISVSLATLELMPSGAGTRLVMTEQGAFLDGYDDAGSRERGTQFLLDALGRSLQD
ncbi:SRPBCC family protein [Ralstonia solanacearum]|uniref:Glutathione s-transferase protein n=1 Tax=Ralstonia solanacearum (strain Po82) TaxID=1031711 RepID=F6G151_RALS8|nr:SRPBCC domain-containing protein [Ralstonia solanacearum]AEG68779.1 glutathione s-transferase protein [Ralstonia solanacearum Po82]AMP70005.1 polyketide cyclase [Ralstonia solanacearum]AMP73089.1 polyketide cyclase [Ralstonia solanacearum]AYB60393.1 polyketide cyclase [Ralstonia solanacearum]MBB6587218.1 SRPBCC domain-containing protein [Ralstonia solanacearum]